MHLPSSLTVPHWRAIFRHAVPNVVEGKLIPAALFIVVWIWIIATIAGYLKSVTYNRYPRD